MSEGILRVDEVEVGHVVYLVEDTPDGPRRTPWCEVALVDGRPAFVGHHLDEPVAALRMPDDGRRVETLATTPGFARPKDVEWKRGVWLVVDTETTGLDQPDIVELGAVLMQEGRVLERRNVLLRPSKPIDPRASAVHGIYDRHVASAPRLHDPHPVTSRSAADGLCAMAARAHAVVGYNNSTFDQPLLERLIPDWSAACAGLSLLDALVVVRLDGVDRRPRSKGRHKLTAVADWLRLTEPEPGMKVQAHRAAWDCVLAGRVLWHLREHVPDDATAAHAMCAREGARQKKELDDYWASRGGR